MGFLFNYDKPGKGIDKDAPKKWGPFLYMELLGRKLGILVKSNLLYFLTSIPVILVYHFLIFMILSSNMPTYGIDDVNQISSIFAIVLTILWGTGPVSCGYTFILRNSAREEHVWLWSDFFSKTKENFKKGIVFWLVDVATLVLAINAVIFYGRMAEKSAIFLYLMFLVIMFLLVYTFMHFYLYQFTVTFDNKIGAVYKNSFLMALAGMPMNLLLTAIVFVCSYFALGMLSMLGIIIVSLICWISLMRFPIDFYTARAIKKKLIGDDSEKGSDE